MVRSFCIITLLTGIFSLHAHCQELISNGGFEKLVKCPYALGDFYPEGWLNSSKGTTPDIFSYCTHDKAKSHPDWVHVKPYEGQAFGGLALYSFKDDYRESITNQLKEPLEADKKYILTFYLSVPYICRYVNQNIHVYFTETKLFQIGKDFVNREKPVLLSIAGIPTDGTWTKYTFEYTAKGGEQYLSFGNYNDVKNTIVKEIEGRNNKLFKKEFNHSYLAIDGVSLQTKEKKIVAKIDKKEPKVEVKEPKKVKKRTFVLRDIQFRVNAYTLENENIPELDTIVAIMKNHPNKTIHITGYTDNRGDKEFNLHLSKKRAATVADLIIKKGIDSSRVKHEGKGDQSPLESNETPEGRAQNRRVEIVLQ